MIANGKMEQQRSDEAHLETCLIRYYEQHARHLASAEPTRYGLAKWSEFFAGALVSEITPARQREFVKSLRDQGLSSGYIRRVLAVGQAALNRAQREGEVSAASSISLTLAPEGDPRERLLTLEEEGAVRCRDRAASDDVSFAGVRHGGSSEGDPRPHIVSGRLRRPPNSPQSAWTPSKQEAAPDVADL